MVKIENVRISEHHCNKIEQFCGMYVGWVSYAYVTT